jgi:hypothetical protein
LGAGLRQVRRRGDDVSPVTDLHLRGFDTAGQVPSRHRGVRIGQRPVERGDIVIERFDVLGDIDGGVHLADRGVDRDGAGKRNPHHENDLSHPELAGHGAPVAVADSPDDMA